MDPRHAVLFEPVRIGPKVLPNRLYQVPHATGFGSSRPQAQAAFRGMRAEGGWGGVCVEYAPVSADSDEAPFVAADILDDSDARALARAAAAIHAHGSLAGLELYHGGASSNNVRSRLPRMAPTREQASRRWGVSARTMTLDDIQRVQADFVTAARRARDAGFDIVYVYGAHGYLLTQFLSTAWNQRTDAYGGSLAGRSRFVLETLAGVREAIGADCAVATRLCLDGREGIPGIHVDDMLEFVRLADPLVDLFDVIVGSWPEDSGTSRFFPEGHELPWTARMHEATSTPVVGVGRFTSPDVMADVVRSGALDIIGAARPAIADPFLPRKIAEGRTGDIRECVGANVCIMREEVFGQIGCVQNPTAGEEYRRGWHPERVPPTPRPERTLLIVGAGPAGLECAVTLGRRGYGAVHLVDEQEALGGRLRWLRRLPGLGDWGRIADWRIAQLRDLPEVTVITGRALTESEILGYGADTVVLATGSRWSGDGTQPGVGGVIAEGLLTPEAIMAGARPRGRRVVVYDADGFIVGPGIAELLAAEGLAVTLATPFPVVSPLSDHTLEGSMLRRHLHRAGIVQRTGVTVLAFDGTHARGRDPFGDEVAIPADDIVLVTHEVPRDGLGTALAGIDLHVIGDAAAPGPVSEAVFDGHRLALALDAPAPVLLREGLAQ